MWGTECCVQNHQLLGCFLSSSGRHDADISNSQGCCVDRVVWPGSGAVLISPWSPLKDTPILPSNKSVLCPGPGLPPQPFEMQKSLPTATFSGADYQKERNGRNNKMGPLFLRARSRLGQMWASVAWRRVLLSQVRSVKKLLWTFPQR